MLLTTANIQRFSLHDGPGIRTTFFLKGCNLNCGWCHNPETLNHQPEILYNANRCLNCGLCETVCMHSFPYGGYGVDNSQCSLCGLCVDICPTGALELCGTTYSATDLLAIGLRDSLFYRHSGGGITLSGGEPLIQSGTSELLSLFRDHGIHTAVDTALAVPWPLVEKVIPFTSLLLVDVKAINSEAHRRVTGIPNELVLSNLTRLVLGGFPLEIRIPVIPGGNIDEIPKIAGFLNSFRNRKLKIRLIPFHNFGLSKYNKLGKPYTYADTRIPTDQEIAEYRKLFSMHIMED